MKGISIDDPEMKDFRDNTDTVNALAERAKGFVWRDVLDPNATPVPNVLNDEQVLINFSVWEDITSLQEFTYKTFHATIMKRQKEWFQKYGTAHYALWWIRSGEIPPEQEAIERLTYLQENGASQRAFTFKDAFEMPKE